MLGVSINDVWSTEPFYKPKPSKSSRDAVPIKMKPQIAYNNPQSYSSQQYPQQYPQQSDQQVTMQSIRQQNEKEYFSQQQHQQAAINSPQRPRMHEPPQYDMSSEIRNLKETLGEIYEKYQSLQNYVVESEKQKHSQKEHFSGGKPRVVVDDSAIASPSDDDNDNDNDTGNNGGGGDLVIIETKTKKKCKKNYWKNINWNMILLIILGVMITILIIIIIQTKQRLDRLLQLPLLYS